MYTRKTADEYHITANYGYGDGWETVCVEDNMKDAREQKKCYLANDPREYKIVKRRVRLDSVQS